MVGRAACRLRRHPHPGAAAGGHHLRREVRVVSGAVHDEPSPQAAATYHLWIEFAAIVIY